MNKIIDQKLSDSDKMFNDLSFLKEIANTIRGLSMDAILAANSGHPGLPLGMADVATVLWSKFLKHNPSNPNWHDRDRFVLSGGHGSMLLYSLLHIYGYDLPLSEIKNFRQWESKTPGHPEVHETAGVETTTGPLGQGLANAVGMALAEAHLAGKSNKGTHNIVDHYTYCFVGDGDLEEGISHEVCSFAGHNKLSKLIVFYDSNRITIDGPTSLSFSDHTYKRFKAYGWDVIDIDGHDYKEIEDAIKMAKRDIKKPSLIICNTQIGFGSPNRAGTSKAHGEPFPEEEVKLTKKALGMPENKKFYIPKSVTDISKTVIKRGKALEKEWDKRFEKFCNSYSGLHIKYTQAMNGEVPSMGFKIPKFDVGTKMATRAASGKIIEHLIEYVPALIGGSADLTPSNKTLPKHELVFSPKYKKGRYIHYGVREHGMAAIMNGMALHGGLIPYAGTFFVFTDYMRPAMRMSALMQQQVIYVLTHDSIGLGEDGPTHQPIGHLAAMRAIPNMSVVRPMDANETVEAWKLALRNTKGPTCLVLTRQGLPTIDRSSRYAWDVSKASQGAYVVIEDDSYSVIIMASGSEVHIAMEAREILNKEGIEVRIVSMMSMDVFEKQSDKYKQKVLPWKKKRRVAIEAGATMPWYKYVGMNGKVIGLDHFGASAPYEKLYQEFGLTAEAVVKAVKEVL